MQDYKEAAVEFSQAVADKPASIEAHVGLINSLVGTEQFDNAVNEMDIVRKLAPQGNQAVELSRLAEGSVVKAAEQFINSSNDTSQMSLVGAAVYQAKVDTLFSNVELLRKVGGTQSIPFLKLLMANPTASLASKAESILQNISAQDVSATLDALLASSDTAVKTRTAKRLWKESKSPKAGEVLLDTIKHEVTTAGRGFRRGVRV